MVDFETLKVSLTKNGYFKVAELLKVHSRSEVLDNLVGVHPGINIVRSQIANIIDCNPATNDVPEFWDSIREHGNHAIDAFTVVAMLFSHHRIIEVMQAASIGRDEFKGYFLRTDFPREKEFTNWAYTLACFGLSHYKRGAGAVEFDLSPVVYHLRSAGELVRDLIKQKFLRAGWRDPSRYAIKPDRELVEEMRVQKVNCVLSMEWPRFTRWLRNELTIRAPASPFGLHDVGLFGK